MAPVTPRDAINGRPASTDELLERVSDDACCCRSHGAFRADPRSRSARPKSWPRTIGLAAGLLVATYLLTVLVAAAIGPAADADQGISLFWDGSRAQRG